MNLFKNSDIDSRNTDKKKKKKIKTVNFLHFFFLTYIRLTILNIHKIQYKM